MTAWQSPSQLQAAVAEPVFSVVIPTYQRRDAVVAAVLSALEQSIAVIEVIVVIDGSTDGTELALQAIKDPRLSIIVQQNRGASAARNAGIDQARGRYIAFLDCDDRFLPHHLADLLPLLEENENIVAYGQVLADRGGGRNFLKPPRAIQRNEPVDRYLMCDRGFIQTSSVALSRSLAEKVRYREDVKFGDDTDFALRLSLAGAVFVMASRPGTIWTDRQAQDRLSQVRGNVGSLAWLADLRPHISTRAFSGYMGWHAAKSIWPTERLRAIRYYLTALLHGAYGPRLAGAVLMQIVLPDGVYRSLCDRWIDVSRLFTGRRQSL
ncbi:MULTISPECIES: glycosyltransferase family 2 protein [Sphingomonadales]|jgi:glycosyltransferase involved in cell wall biosynthesis|uniref:Glycosyltransferase n=1 Tax=Sphingobium agri TaxID=2933566 RepID=A0ABT0DW84_9SPHN|nr:MULTISPECIES: glycosyltransferase family 2 protein [Sphingomonadaceae]MCK0531319.1 glycosyltransferase [Sphingobium agri]